MTTIDGLKTQKKHLVDYILVKIDAEDWHAVQDAASDIREIEARLEVLEIVSRQESRGER